MGPTRKQFLRLRFVEDPANPDPGTNPPAGGGATFTQAQLDQIVQGRVAQAERAAAAAAATALEQKLGGKSLDDILAQASAADAATEAAKTEAQRTLDAANATKTEAENLKSQAVNELHAFRVQRALVSAGADEKATGDIRVDVPVGASVEDIATAVTALKGRLPALFVKPATPPADPGTPPATPPAAGGGFAAGRDRAKAERA